MKDKHAFLIAITAVVAVVLYVTAAVLYSDTLVSLWAVVIFCVLMAGALFFPMRGLWPKVTRSSNRLLNLTVHFVVMAGAVAALFFVANYCGADMSTLHTETAVASRKYTKTRHRTRRINRRVTGRGEPYTVYFVEFTMNDGRVKTLEMSSKQYHRIRSGNEVEMQVARGMLGFPVIRRDKPITDTGHLPGVEVK